MKVLLFNGSPREKGCTHAALTEISSVLNAEGVETEIIWCSNSPVRDCIACGGCKNTGKCVFGDDIVNDCIKKAKTADGFIFGSPVYYSHPTGRLLAVMDRLFYAGKYAFVQKPAAVIAAARRAGTTSSLDVLLKHLTVSQMPVISSTYWNFVYGSSPEEILRDLEGMQTMRNLAKNMAWIIKCINAGKAAGIAAPQAETTARTNFIR